jgi:hypothetical protein
MAALSPSADASEMDVDATGDIEENGYVKRLKFCSE